MPPTPAFIDLTGQTFGDWRDDLAVNGFAVIKSVVTPEKAQTYCDRAYQWIENWGLGFKRDDPSTWTADKIPVVRKGGMFHHSIGQEAFLWDLRQEPKLIEAFAKLWGTDELLVSFDGANISLPGPMQDLNQPAWWHVDQDPDKRGFLCAQGLVNLVDNGPDDGGLMVLKGSHKLNTEYFTEVWNGTDGFQLTGAEAQPDFFGFDDNILKWFYAHGCEWVKTEVGAGDLIIWDSRTVHYNVPPKGNRSRIAAYTCYAPASIAAPDQLKMKQDIFKARKMTVRFVPPFPRLAPS
ncbi:hypothetical protein PLICRDRAFT_96719 [Plicaturopsis crispa FD-325 SS-3]|nr:hypothetical protein PLICRDRAFT_96719 [Plicaturopsis crispa FD-325 SS-3]